MPNIEKIVTIAASGSMSTLTDSSRQGSFTSNVGSRTTATVSGTDLDKIQSLKIRVYSYNTEECYTFEFEPTGDSSEESVVFAHVGEEALGLCTVQYLIVNGQIMWIIPDPKDGVRLDVKVHEDFVDCGKVSVDGSNASQENNTAKLPGTPIAIEAIPEQGYVFDRWSDGNTNASRTVTIQQATTLYAFFKPGDDESLIDHPYVSAVKIGVGDELQSLDRDNIDLTFTVNTDDVLTLEVHGVKVNQPDNAYIGAKVADTDSTTVFTLSKQEGSTSDVAVYTWKNVGAGNAYKYTFLELGSYKCWKSAEA